MTERLIPWLLARPPVPSTIRQFMSFAFIGAFAFLVDAAVLTLMLYIDNNAFFLGRFISFLCAVTFTWYFNRRITFKSGASDEIVSQFSRFVAVNSGGGAVNFGMYSVLVLYFPYAKEWPVLAAGLGSLSGLAVNFCLSKFFVFQSPSKGNP